MISGLTAPTGKPGEKAKIKTSPTGNKRAHREKRAAAGQQGFTLLEVTLVLSLAAILAGLVMPGLYGTWKRERERASVRQLMATLRTARSQAALQHQRVRVFVDLNSGGYRLEGSAGPGQVTGVRLAEAHLVWQDLTKQQGYIAFYGDGTSSGGRLALLGPGGQRQVLEVEVITGKVSLKAGG